LIQMKPGRHSVFPLSLFLCSLFLFIPGPVVFAAITSYRPIFRAGTDPSGHMRIAIRSFKKDDIPFLLVVDPYSFATSTMKTAFFSPEKEDAPQGLSETPYVRALHRYTNLPEKLQNYGVVHSCSPVDGVFLTIDMCPSKRTFAKDFFAYLGKLSEGKERGTPIAVSISGKWLLKHRDEFAWLKERIREGTLAVTWVNHSFSHPYYPGAPLERNFLLTAGIDFTEEVLENERLLLENGVVPSPFFRFPGLVSDGRLIRELGSLSLIPLGSDAWLAKGELPVKGSIILVHGNGNEPLGVRMALRILRERPGMKLLPVADAFTGSDCKSAE
jgi:hypothetical protein